MIRWILAEGKEEDREVDPPDTTDEIVILKYEQWPGRAQYLPLVDEHDDLDDTVITFARAGNDDLLGWNITEIAAMRLYHKVEGDDAPAWAFLSKFSKRTYIGYAQTMLAGVMEHLRELREQRGQGSE